MKIDPGFVDIPEFFSQYFRGRDNVVKDKLSLPCEMFANSFSYEAGYHDQNLSGLHPPGLESLFCPFFGFDFGQAAAARLVYQSGRMLNGCLGPDRSGATFQLLLIANLVTRKPGPGCSWLDFPSFMSVSHLKRKRLGTYR